MSTKPDRLSLEIACDFLEENGFTDAVPVFRKWVADRCRPTIDEVLPLAIEYHLKNQGSVGGLFLGRENLTDHELWAQKLGSDNIEFRKLLDLLSAMTTKQRRIVAGRTRDAVDRERRERNRPLNLEESPGAYRSLDQWRGDSETLLAWRRANEQVSNVQTQAEPTFQFPDPMPEHITVDGVEMLIVEAGRSNASGEHYLLANPPSGYTRRFSGRQLRDLFAQPHTDTQTPPDGTITLNDMQIPVRDVRFTPDRR